LFYFNLLFLGLAGGGMTYWSIRYQEMMKGRETEDRGQFTKREYKLRVEAAEVVSKKVKELLEEESTEGLNEEERKKKEAKILLRSREIVKEQFSQKEKPKLEIIDRFGPDAPLHGKANVALRVLTRFLDAIKSICLEDGKRPGPTILLRIINEMKLFDKGFYFICVIYYHKLNLLIGHSLKSVAISLYKEYLSEADEDKNHKTRLEGGQANDLLMYWFPTVIAPVFKYYEEHNLVMDDLLLLKVSSVSTMFISLSVMQKSWNLLFYEGETKEQVEKKLTELESAGEMVIWCFKLFFMGETVTPWVTELSIDVPQKARELYQTWGIGYNIFSCQQGEGFHPMA
jgi:hypothetical protein